MIGLSSATKNVLVVAKPASLPNPSYSEKEAATSMHFFCFVNVLLLSLLLLLLLLLLLMLLLLLLLLLLTPLMAKLPSLLPQTVKAGILSCFISDGIVCYATIAVAAVT